MSASTQENEEVDVGTVLASVNAELGCGWRVERYLTGGWNEGAYLLSQADGSRAVLKWRSKEPERLLNARDLVATARARGWPAPAWLAAGLVPGEAAWVLQEFIDGRTPRVLDDHVAEQMIGILDLQASLFPGAEGGWGEWACGVVFEDWEDMRDRVRSGFPGGRRIVAAVDSIAESCSPDPLTSQDLVHGNFNLANTIATPGWLWVVDTESLGPGPRAYDLAEALLVGAGHGTMTDSAAARLLAYGAGLDRREFAICAGSVGLSMAEFFVRHDRPGDGASAVPGMLQILEQVRSLAASGAPPGETGE